LVRKLAAGIQIRVRIVAELGYFRTDDHSVVFLSLLAIVALAGLVKVFFDRRK
jgi:hypothetical protein